jgi:hypothetical protein
MFQRQRRAQEGASGAHARPVRGGVHVDVGGAEAHRPVYIIQNGHADLSGGRRRIGRPTVPADIRTSLIGDQMDFLIGTAGSRAAEADDLAGVLESPPSGQPELLEQLHFDLSGNRQYA